MSIEKQLIEYRECEWADYMSAQFNGVTRLSDGKQFEFAIIDWDAQVVEYGNDAGVCETYKLELRQGDRLTLDDLGNFSTPSCGFKSKEDFINWFTGGCE